LTRATDSFAGLGGVQRRATGLHPRSVSVRRFDHHFVDFNEEIEILGVKFAGGSTAVNPVNPRLATSRNVVGENFMIQFSVAFPWGREGRPDAVKIFFGDSFCFHT